MHWAWPEFLEEIRERTRRKVIGFVRTMTAVVLCCLLIWAASLLGAIAHVGYRWILECLSWPTEMLGSGGQVLVWFVSNGTPSLVYGTASSALAVFIVTWLFHSTRAKVVGVWTAGSYTLLYIVLLSVKGNLTQASIEAGVQLVGLWLGVAFCVRPGGDARHDARRDFKVGAT